MRISRKRNKRNRSPKSRKYKDRIGGGLNSKKHYHIYNIYHYGDNIFNLKFFFGIVDILKQHNIIIHYYYDPAYIKNVDELTRYVNPEVVILDTLDKKPADAYNMWMGNYDYLNIESAVNTMYKDVLKHLGLENLQIDTSIYQKEDYLIDIYNKLDPKFKDLKVLILNNEPKSAQFNYNKENMDAMCIRLASKFKVAVVSPVNDIPCTLTDGLKLQDIGAISTGAEYIIGFNSGPLIPCFNIHTKNKVKKWILLDTMGTKINEINVDFITKETNVNSKIVQTGGSKKYRHRTKKTKKRDTIYKINQKGGDVIFIFCMLSNGLGNQLFKYANALTVQKILNIPILLFNTIFKAHSSVDYRPFFKKGELKNESEFQERINKAETVPNIDNYDEKPYLAKIPEYRMKDIKLEKEFNHIYTLIKDVIPVIKSDFIGELKSRYPEFEATILNGLTRENLVFMHVRKGDYDSYKWSSPADYFKSALDIIDTIPEIKIVYIVSDDIAYCKEQLKNNMWKSTKELKIYDEADELKCMYVMSLCNGGGILSSSTFSWWGAMFGPNDSPNSVIIYPNNIKYNNDVRLSFPAQVGNKWRMISETKGGDAKCIFCTLNGGLGNKLHMYACGLNLKTMLKMPLYLLDNKDNPHSSVDYKNYFKQGIPIDRLTVEDRLKNAVNLPEIDDINKESVLTMITPYKANDIKLENFSKYNDYTLIKDVIPVIKSDFIGELKLKYPEFEASILNGVTRENLVFMHVRRGDYGINGWLTPSQYFISALNIIDTIAEIKIVYIVSDDIAYCKEQLKNNIWKSTKELKVFDEPDELKCMYLMSLCNGGGILSASTFSWWGAIFGPNDSTNSVILYPTVKQPDTSGWKKITKWREI